MDEAQVRLRLVAVLWERLAELEADLAREAASRRIDWDSITGLQCRVCHRVVFHQLVDGQCRRCAKANSENLRLVRQRLSELGRRYPKLVTGLRKKLLRLRG